VRHRKGDDLANGLHQSDSSVAALCATPHGSFATDFRLIPVMWQHAGSACTPRRRRRRPGSHKTSPAERAHKSADHAVRPFWFEPITINSKE